MATYRTVYMSFWTDPKVDDDFTPEDKYFYLYLLTNPHTSLCGCYEISMKQMVRETGYNEDTVKRLIDRMSNTHHVVQYDPSTKEVFIPKWGKYNWSNSPKTISGAITVAEKIKSVKFREAFNEILIGYGYPMDTLSIPPTYPMDTSVTVTDTVTDTVSDTDTVPVTDTKDTPQSLFEVFIKDYPNPVDVDRARAAWYRLDPDPDLVIDIMDGLAAWKESEQWEDPKYIPYPANWLNNKRWEQKPPKRRQKTVASGKTFPGQNYEQKPIPSFSELSNLIPEDL